MKQSTLIQEFLGTLYNCTYMPIHYYIDQDLISIFPSWALPIDELLLYNNAAISQGITFDYIVTDENLFMGIVRNDETNQNVIIGPVSTIRLSADDIHRIIVDYALDEQAFEAMETYFERTPSFSLNQFLNILSLINHRLNGKFIDVLSLQMEKNTQVENTVAQNHSSSLMERKEYESYHNTYYFEQEYYGYVEKGDVSGLELFLKNVPQFQEGKIAEDFIRQAKNIFISTIALTTRHAIAGGLDIETAYELSDSYIQEMEKMSDSASVYALNVSAVFDFTRRVCDAKIPHGMSLEIFKCIQYIANHINTDISVEKIANELNMDRSTLSKKFKRELGFNISSYIMRRKLEEAKSLLSYTDKTISEISEYLCFSTQSYFQNVFKKKYGLTPKEFRKKKGLS